MHFTYLRLPRQVGVFYTSAAAARRAPSPRWADSTATTAGASITEDMDLGQRFLNAGHVLRLREASAGRAPEALLAARAAEDRFLAGQRPDQDTAAPQARQPRARSRSTTLRCPGTSSWACRCPGWPCSSLLAALVWPPALAGGSCCALPASSCSTCRFCSFLRRQRGWGSSCESACSCCRTCSSQAWASCMRLLTFAAGKALLSRLIGHRAILNAAITAGRQGVQRSTHFRRHSMPQRRRRHQDHPRPTCRRWSTRSWSSTTTAATRRRGRPRARGARRAREPQGLRRGLQGRLQPGHRRHHRRPWTATAPTRAASSPSCWRSCWRKTGTSSPATAPATARRAPARSCASSATRSSTGR